MTKKTRKKCRELAAKNSLPKMLVEKSVEIDDKYGLKRGYTLTAMVTAIQCGIIKELENMKD